MKGTSLIRKKRRSSSGYAVDGRVNRNGVSGCANCKRVPSGGSTA